MKYKVKHVLENKGKNLYYKYSVKNHCFITKIFPEVLRCIVYYKLLESNVVSLGQQC